MAINMTGLASGLDTENIIKELMNAQNLKKTKLVNKQTTLTWKQDKWKDLNSKIYKLYTDQVSKMRLQGSYLTKTTTSSNETLVTATSSSNAPVGTQTLEVLSLASSQHVTGSKVSDVTLKSKFADLNKSAIGNEIKITAGKEVKTLQITADTRVEDVVNLCKEAGLNASFDEKQGRFFISSKGSGKDNAFTITSAVLSNEQITSTKKLEELVNYDTMSSSDKTIVRDALNTIKNSSDATKVKEAETKLEEFAKKAVEDNQITAVKNNLRKTNEAKLRKDTHLMNALQTKYESSKKDSITEEVKKELGESAKEDDIKKEVEIRFATEETKKEIEASINKEIVNRAASELSTQTELINQYSVNGMTEDDLKELGFEEVDINNKTVQVISSKENAEKTATTELTNAIKTYKEATPTTETSSVLSSIGLSNIDGSEVTGGSGMTVISAKDSEILLNGATLVSDSNTITANGITFELKGETKGEKVSLSISDNSQKTFDVVKEFIGSYNTMLKEMNSLYGAPSSKGYEPLTDEQKEAMSDEQILLWENKIKDSLLRRDPQLGSLTTAMKSALQMPVTVDGKQYSLNDFGISTSTDYSEKGLLHIYGDESDSIYAERENKLMKALEEDPEIVGKVLSEVCDNLYKTMQDKMKAVKGTSSALTFYQDKQLEKQQTQYKKDIAKLEARLEQVESKYYKQFSAMEVALSKLNSQSSYLSGLFTQ